MSEPCKNCGHCPHCGRALEAQPYYVGTYWPNPYSVYRVHPGPSLPAPWSQPWGGNTSGNVTSAYGGNLQSFQNIG